jgi:signal peptidase I
MEPTLLIGDHILVNKFIYGIMIPFTEKKLFQFVTPKRGDVVVFIYPEDPSKDFIKRVIAVEGEQLSVRDKKIFINGKQIEDPYGVYRDPNVISGWGSEMSRDNFGPVTVPPHSLFVMGDNRDKSFDSRFWGYVDMDKVKGKAFIIYWSWGGFFRTCAGVVLERLYTNTNALNLFTLVVASDAALAGERGNLTLIASSCYSWQ